MENKYLFNLLAASDYQFLIANSWFLLFAPLYGAEFYSYVSTPNGAYPRHDWSTKHLQS